MTERLILVAEVAGAFGLKGELRITAFTADPLSLLSYGPLLAENGSVVLTLAGGRAVKGALIARTRPAMTRSQAESLGRTKLFIQRSTLPTADDEDFYVADLVGLEAVSPAGERLGLVKSVANFGAGDLLEIAPDDGATTWWVAFTRAMVPDVRFAEGQLVVDRPEDGGAA